MPKALLIDPYLDSLGGGERYILTIAESLLQQNWQVDLLWDNAANIKATANNKFNLDIGQASFVPSAEYHSGLLSRYKFTSSYDVIFAITDGSVPFLFGKKNIIHFQVPFHGVFPINFITSLKKFFIHHYVCNSKFTQHIIDQEYRITSSVIYPPVAVQDFTSSPKQPVILYVSRFSNLLQYKGHAELITAFKTFHDRGNKQFKLVLAGGTEQGSDQLLTDLKQSAQNYPIEFIINPPFSQLRELYSHAMFFWSAAGYDINPQTNPEQCEHFGISLVEAMASGCVPIVLNNGGYPEIIQSGKSGYLWQTLDELPDLTEKTLVNPQALQHLSFSAVSRAQDFSKQKFADQILKIFNES